MEAGPAAADRLAAGHEALERHAWQEAFELLSALAGEGSLEPSDLEALATALHWLGRRSEAIDAREQAYAGYVEAGWNRDAARVAIALSDDYGERMLASATSPGWLRRAGRLLEDEPVSREHGEILVRRARALGLQRDFGAAIKAARKAQKHGRRVGSRDVEGWGLVLEGSALVRVGRVDDGLELLAEASAAAVGEELEPFTTLVVHCVTIDCCRDVGDDVRASEWADTAEHWCTRHSLAGFPAVFRLRRAEIAARRGP